MTKDEVKNLSFEEALGQLEGIVQQLESGKIKLDEAVASYEKAVMLKNACEKRLQAAKMKVEKLEISKDGDVKRSPLDD